MSNTNWNSKGESDPAGDLNAYLDRLHPESPHRITPPPDLPPEIKQQLSLFAGFTAPADAPWIFRGYVDPSKDRYAVYCVHAAPSHYDDRPSTDGDIAVSLPISMRLFKAGPRSRPSSEEKWLGAVLCRCGRVHWCQSLEPRPRMIE